jgi:hypothetical protein
MLFTASPETLRIAIIASLAVLGLLTFQRNRRLTTQWQRAREKDFAQALSRAFWFQTLQTWVALLLLAASIIYYDGKVRALEVTVQELAQSNLVNSSTASALSPAPATAKPAYYPPATAQPAAKPAAAQAPAKPKTLQPLPTQNVSTAEVKTSIADIFGGSSRKNDPQNSIDALKRQYEELLVSYFFLKKCQKAGQKDYPLIINNLQKDMQRLQAPSRLQYDVLTAAQGSYKELYARNSCTQVNTESIAQEYAKYLQMLTERNK